MERRAGGNVVVEDAEGADNGGISVRQQREVDVHALGEVLEDLGAVIGDDGEAETLGGQLVFLFRQLDELALAVGSPIRGADEGEHEAIGSTERFQALRLAVLIGEREGRDSGADFGAGFHVLSGLRNGAEARAVVGLGHECGSEQAGGGSNDC